jgi:hypothetical protein
MLWVLTAATAMACLLAFGSERAFAGDAVVART